MHDDPMGVSAAFCAMVCVAAMVFFAGALAGAIIACELCLLVRRMETAAEYYVREEH